jgi:sensor c-di-GMP phosphodiesterase-like protein
MGWFLGTFTRRNIVAIAVGVVLAAGSLLAFEFWLGGVINREGQEEVDTSVLRAITLAETRVNDVIGMLDDLAAQGVNACQPDQIAAMRRAAFNTTPVKEIEIIGFDGQTLCSQLGVPLGNRRLLSSERLAGADGYFIDIVQLAGGRHMVRLRRKVGDGPAEIAALVPTMLFLPQVSTRGGPFGGYARIATQGGAVIGQVGRPLKARVNRFIAKLTSRRFGFRAEVATPRGPLSADKAELKWLGIMISGGIIVMVGIIAALTSRRTGGNPVAEIERALAAGEFVPYY